MAILRGLWGWQIFVYGEFVGERGSVIVLGDIFHLNGGCRVPVFCIMSRIYDRLRRYNNRSCQKVEIAKRMSYDIIIKL